MFYLLLFCFLFSPTTFGHHDGYTELKENTDTVILTQQNTTLINLEPQSNDLINFWIKEDPFEFYIDPKECETGSTSFIIGGGNFINLQFMNITFNNGLIVNLNIPLRDDSNLNLDERKIKVTFKLHEKQLYFNDVRNNETYTIMYALDDLAKFPFHGEQPRVTFFALNTGTCNISYEMSRDFMVPLHKSSSHHHHDATTTPPSSTTTDESKKDWYEGSTFQKIVYAYMWVLSCALAFIVGVCAGRSKSPTYRPRTESVEIDSPNV